MRPSELDPAGERHWVCAQRLRTRRLALGLTQLDVASRLEQRGLPVTEGAVSAMEDGQGLDLGMLPELATALDCTVTYLLGLTPDPRQWQPEGTGAPGRSPVPPLRAGSTARPGGATAPDPAGQDEPDRSAARYRTCWRDPGSGP